MEASVSDHSGHKGATKIHASKGGHGGHDDEGGGGGGGKWLLGAVAAAVLLGGGYYAWSNYGPAQSDTQTAYNDSFSDRYGDDPLRAGPADDDNAVAQSATTEDDVAAPAAATETPRATPARRQAARATPAPAPIPEETIGVTPISASTEESVDGDDIVVTGARRPVWTRTPNERRLTALYPERDLNRGREGEARLSCTVLADGALDCARAEETSSSFGRAALRVARTFRHAPTLADGSDATGTPVNLRVVFRMDEDTRRG